MASIRQRDTQAAGLGTSGARYTLIVVWALGLWATLMSYPIESLSVYFPVVFLLQLLTLILLTSPGSKRLSVAHGLICTVLAISAGVLAIEIASPPEDSWPFNFSTYLLALLSIRGNLREGVAGGALITIGTFGYFLQDGVGFWQILAFLALPLVAFCVGIIWRISIASAVARERAYIAAATKAQLAAAAARAATLRDQALIDEVRDDAAPVLNSLIQGHAIDDTQALKISVVQEGIRDRIRSPQLRHPLLNAEIKAARLRGVQVILLGNNSAAASKISGQLAQAISEIIAEIAQGSVTVRSHPRTNNAAFTVLVNSKSYSRRYALSSEGTVLNTR